MTISSSAPGKSTMAPQLDKQNFTVTKNGFGSAGSNPGPETLNVNLYRHQGRLLEYLSSVRTQNLPGKGFTMAIDLKLDKHATC